MWDSGSDDEAYIQCTAVNGLPIFSYICSYAYHNSGTQNICKSILLYKGNRLKYKDRIKTLQHKPYWDDYIYRKMK